MNETKTKTKTRIQNLAQTIRGELPADEQPKLFRTAVEAGYLAALADGDADPEEMAALVHAIEELSDGVVVGWEVDVLIEECNEHIGMEGQKQRAAVVGNQLQQLGHSEAGMLIAAYVAFATGGLHEKEVDMLRQIGEAAGLDGNALAPLVKKARGAI
jgi:tellurite resistance protein